MKYFLGLMFAVHTLQLVALQQEHIRYFPSSPLHDFANVIFSFVSIALSIAMIFYFLNNRSRGKKQLCIGYLLFYGLFSFYVFTTKISPDPGIMFDGLSADPSVVKSVVKGIIRGTGWNSILLILFIFLLLGYLDKKYRIFREVPDIAYLRTKRVIALTLYLLMIIFPRSNLDEITNFLIAAKRGIIPIQLKARPQLLSRIAHAAGGIAGVTETNSYEALSHNYDKGFRYFEVDFHRTSDDKIVCLHDWEDTFKKVFKFQTEGPLSLDEFLFYQKRVYHQPCTITGLFKWLETHPGSRIITDAKTDNLETLQSIAKQYPGYSERFIPQIYQPENYQHVKKLGYKDIIWILYKYHENNQEVSRLVSDMDLFAVAMSRPRVESGLPLLLQKQNILSYLFTVNSSIELKKYEIYYGVSNVYTDFLTAND